MSVPVPVPDELGQGVDPQPPGPVLGGGPLLEQNVQNIPEQPQPALVPYPTYPSSEIWSNIAKQVVKREYRADVDLIVRDDDDQEVRFPVHSTWLTLRSPGLDQIIQGLDINSRELVLPNVKARILKLALHFIRMGCWEKRIRDDEDLIGLVKFDNEFPSTGLSKKCVRMLKKRLNVTNAINIWKKSIELNVRNLVDTSLTFILWNAKDVFATDEFLNLAVQDISELLKNDGLNASEVDVFNAVLRWGNRCLQPTAVLNLQSQQENIPPPNPTQQTLRTVINPLLPFIRFTLMSPEVLAQVVRPLNILTDQERLLIFDYILSPIDSKPVLTIFNSQPSVSSRIHRRSENSPTNVDITPQPQIIRTTAHWNRFARNQNDLQNIQRMSVFPQFLQQSALSAANQNPRKRGRTPSSDLSTCQSTDSSVSMFYDKQDCVYPSFEDFVNHFGDNPEDVLHSTYKIRLKNVAFQTNYTYPSVLLRNLQRISLDLSINVDMGKGNREEALLRFEKSFDVRKYIFFRRSIDESMDVDLSELWDRKTPINIVINGVTMLRLNFEKMELAIGFRSDAYTILSGVGRGEHLQKLCLMKSDVPDIQDFPCKHLKEVLFYHVFALSEFDVRKFIKRCSSLETFCCWVICPWWEHMKPTAKSGPLYSPTELDLTKDFVSNQKLKYLALCKVVLTLTASPKQAIKAGVTELYLDTCFWEEVFVDNFDRIFPNLKRCGFRQKATNQKIRPKSQHETYKSIVSVRLVHKILNLPNIEWIRIWGLNWNERYLTEVKEGSKKLRSSVTPITEEEVDFVRKFLVENCKIADNCENFILQKDPSTNEWTGEALNDLEPKEYDNGFWDRMERLDYDYYKLDNFFKDYETVQNEFYINLGLPP